MNNYLIVLFCLCKLSLSAQEVTSQLIIPEQFTLNRAEELIFDNDRMYFHLSGLRAIFGEFDMGYDLSFIEDDEHVIDGFGDSTRVKRSAVFEYEPGVGVVDHIYFKYGETDIFAIDGDIYAGTFRGNWLAVEDTVLYVDEDMIYQSRLDQDIVVYDKGRDSLLWYYKDESPAERFIWENIEVDGDYIYYATTYTQEQVFMGDTLIHTYDGFIQHTTMVHKINWRTGVKEWSRHTGAIDIVDQVATLKVVDDGTLYMDIRVNGPFTWGDEILDPEDTFGTGNLLGLDEHNTVIAKISPEGEYIDHVHIINHFSATVRNVTIEDDGTVYCYGISSPGNIAVVDQDSLDLSNEVVNENGTSFGAGVLIVLDSDLEFKWHKKYMGSKTGYVFAANSNSKGVVVSTLLGGTLIADGVTYTNEFIEEVNQSQQLVIQYDHDGNVLGSPVQFGNRMYIKHIIEIDEDHHLVFVETDSHNALDEPVFLGEEIGTVDEGHTNIIEIRGDLFQILNSIKEASEFDDFTLYPNPIHAGNAVNVKLPNEDDTSVNGNISILNLNGKVAYKDQMKIVNSRLQFEIPNIIGGMYVLLVECNGHHYRKSIIIN